MNWMRKSPRFPSLHHPVLPSFLVPSMPCLSFLAVGNTTRKLIHSLTLFSSSSATTAYYTYLHLHIHTHTHILPPSYRLQLSQASKTSFVLTYFTFPHVFKRWVTHFKIKESERKCKLDRDLHTHSTSQFRPSSPLLPVISKAQL